MSRDKLRSRDRPGESSRTGGRPDTMDPLERAAGAGAHEDAGADEYAGGSVGEVPRSAERGRGGLRDRLRRRARRVFSPRAFLAALLLSVGGLLGANAFVPLPGAGLLGVFAATFLLGAVLEERRYAETATAGGLAVAGSVLLDVALVAVLAGLGPSLAALAGVVGAAVAALGTFFGRDLRAGLTREIENGP